MKKFWHFFLFIIIIFSSISYASTKSQDDSDEIYKYLKLFSQVLQLIQSEYVEDVQSKKLIYGAIQGMLKTLDPYSTLLTPDEYKELEIETKGSFTGIGIEITIRDGILTVVAPIEDTPAWRAGLKPGDKIIKIDGKPTKGMSLIEAVKLLRGPKGTKVTITILRNNKVFDVTIIRDVIPIRSVKSALLEKEYGYIKITNFQESTPKELKKALKKLEEKPLKGLILDLRNNPGGLLSSAIKVADEFLDEGIIVSIKGKTDKKKIVFKAQPNPKWDTHPYPIVVLINKGSASASEIVTGALKDNNRAIVIGQKSFGKGKVQTVIPLIEGYAVKLTTAYYYTPKGVCIDKVGITPDIEIPPLNVENGKKKENEFKGRLTIKPEEDFQVKIALSILKEIGKFKQLQY